MGSESPGERAVTACEIDDVFLVSSECAVDRSYNQSQLMDNVPILHRAALEPEILMQTRTLAPPAEGQIHILRYFFRGEVIFAKPGTSPTDEPSEADLMAKLVHIFAVDYVCAKEFFDDKAAVSAFGRNVSFHVWGFWREAILADTGRHRLPRFVVPMLRVNAPNAVSDEPTTQAID